LLFSFEGDVDWAIECALLLLSPGYIKA